MANTTIQKTGHQYKDTLFRSLFGDSKKFLELYNAIAGEQIPDDTIVTPCPSNDLLAKFNDLAACIGNQRSGMTRDKAISKAIDSCIDKDVLTDFLTDHAEVAMMLNWEYDAEAEKRVLREEAIQQGIKEGRKEGRTEGAEQLAQLIKEGTPLEEALEKVKVTTTTTPSS